MKTRAVAAAGKPKIDLDAPSTHVLPLADIDRAFDSMHSGASIRSAVVH